VNDPKGELQRVAALLGTTLKDTDALAKLELKNGNVRRMETSSFDSILAKVSSASGERQ
jgi:hypothetical protein